jgi:hypothetical protein
MSHSKTSLFEQHMKAMIMFYKSRPSHAYALPIGLTAPTTSDPNALIAFAVAKTPPGDLNDLLGKAEKTITNLVDKQKSGAVSAVKAFEAGGGVEAFVTDMKKQEVTAEAAMNSAISDNIHMLMKFGVAHTHAQSHVLELTNKIGVFQTHLLNSMGTFFEKLGTDITQWSHEVVYESAWASIINWLSGAIHSIGHFFTQIGAAAEVAFDAIQKAAKDVWNDAQEMIKKAIEAGEKAILEPIAKALIDGLPIKEICSAWKSISSENGPLVDVVKAAAIGKIVTPESEGAMDKLRQKMEPQVTNFHKQTKQNLSSAALQPFAQAATNSSFLGFGLQFGGSAVYGIGVEGGIGMLVGIPAGNVVGYGSVGVNIGAEVGAEVDQSIVFTVGDPKDSGGVYVGIVLSLVADLGGTIQVGFAFPSFNFTTIAIGLGEGVEAQVAIDGGYTFTF